MCSIPIPPGVEISDETKEKVLPVRWKMWDAAERVMSISLLLSGVVLIAWKLTVAGLKMLSGLTESPLALAPT